MQMKRIRATSKGQGVGMVLCEGSVSVIPRTVHQPTCHILLENVFNRPLHGGELFNKENLVDPCETVWAVCQRGTTL